jgi:hypothetical protein
MRLLLLGGRLPAGLPATRRRLILPVAFMPGIFIALPRRARFVVALSRTMGAMMLRVAGVKLARLPRIEPNGLSRDHHRDRRGSTRVNG